MSVRYLWEEQGGRCWYCENIIPSRHTTVDHVLPRARGGTNEWGNIVAACQKCNTKKANKPTHKKKTLDRLNRLRVKSGLAPMSLDDLGASATKGETTASRAASLNYNSKKPSP
jgi:hypothetical protein